MPPSQFQLDPVREHMNTCGMCSSAKDGSGYCSEGRRLIGVAVWGAEWEISRAQILAWLADQPETADFVVGL